MYIPHHFRNENLDEVKAFLRANAFGILLTQQDNRILGSHIPLELEQDADGHEVFYGHVSKANTQWRSFSDQDVLMIFNGPHAYVSSGWYGHDNVPTWNYVAVHVYGRLIPLEKEELLHSLDRLMHKYEQHEAEPLAMGDLSTETMRQVKGIIGFKVLPTEIQAAYKLSQNRNSEDYHNVIKKLSDKGEPRSQGVAEQMKKNRSDH